MIYSNISQFLLYFWSNTQPWWAGETYLEIFKDQ